MGDKKKDLAYSTDLLRLWAATVEYGSDMSIGPKVLRQTAEKLRKIRNWLVSPSAWAYFLHLWLPWQIEKYVMHDLYRLQRAAFDCNDIDGLIILILLTSPKVRALPFPDILGLISLTWQSWPRSSISQTLLCLHSTLISGRIVSMLIPSEA